MDSTNQAACFRSVLLVLLLAFSLPAPSSDALPARNYVPDAETAKKIAEAVWLPIYGERIYAERPYQVHDDGDTWTVQGSLPAGTVGGTALVVIAKKDGRILRVTHTK